MANKEVEGDGEEILITSFLGDNFVQGLCCRHTAL